MLTWWSDQLRRMETVRIVITERGLRANGYIVQSGDQPYGSSYQFLIDAQGRTRRLTVQTDSAEGERHLGLTRTPGGPWVVESTSGSSPLLALQDADDLDLDSSAFTNALSLRRLALPTADKTSPPLNDEFPIKVGRISLPTLAVRPVLAGYTFRGHGIVSYRQPDRPEVSLVVDDEFFVISFPGMSHRLG